MITFLQQLLVSIAYTLTTFSALCFLITNQHCSKQHSELHLPLFSRSKSQLILKQKIWNFQLHKSAVPLFGVNQESYVNS